MVSKKSKSNFKFKQNKVEEFKKNKLKSLKYILYKNPNFFEVHPYSQRLIWMTPQEFLYLTPSIIEYDKETLIDLRKKMKKGIPLDPLLLDINEKGKIENHEGRHRAKVAEMLGIEKVPVLLYCRDAEGTFILFKQCKGKTLIAQR